MDERIAADISATGSPAPTPKKMSLYRPPMRRRPMHKARHAIRVNSPLPQPVEFYINDALGVTPETSLYPRRHPIDLGPVRLAALIADDGTRQLRFA